jgi:hypothetical protein
MSDVLSGDIIDIRDVIKRFEELESEREEITDRLEDEDTTAEEKAAITEELETWDSEEDGEELKTLRGVLDDLKGYGGDEQWRGDWYPLSLIADSHFEDYAQELAEELGCVKADAQWPNNCIDWERAARELQGDYSSVTVEGSDYWYR